MSSERTTTIDLDFRGCPECVGAFLVRTSAGPVLVEAGPARCLPALEAGLAAEGTGLHEVRELLLTHIHLDHAGATGACTAAGATAHVHPRGARHLIEPERLMASATRVFGSFLEENLGHLEPSPSERVRPVEDGERIVIGDASFTAVETPGHAAHHHAWLLEADGRREVFAGDAAGMRIPGTSFATLPLVAPEFDPQAWQASIERIRGLEPDALWLTHFGRVDEPMSFLDSVSRRLEAETALVSELLENADDVEIEDHIPAYRAWHHAQAETHQVDPALLDRHCPDLHFRSNLVGVDRWLRRRAARSSG